MAINHTETISELYTLENNSDNIVAKVRIDITSTNNVNSEIINSHVVVGIGTSGGKDASGFIPYENLTENDVLGWIETERTTLKTDNTNKLTYRKNLPW